MSYYQMQPFIQKGLRTDRQPFTYDNLDPSIHEIRLVTILPGSWRSKIRCEVHAVSLDTKPKYETLSYVWGDASHQCPILIGDKIFWATINLWMALRRLRTPHEPRVMWIDAICINQQDDQEKSHQVAMMKDIYHSCQRAILWLGEDWYSKRKHSKPQPTSKPTRNAFSLLKMFARTGHINETPCFAVNAPGTLAMSVEPYFRPHFRELGFILTEDWWKRIWIVQEATVSPRAVFAFASEQLPISVWQRAHAWYEHHTRTCCSQQIIQLRTSPDEQLLNSLAASMQRLGRILSTRADFRQGNELSLMQLRGTFNMQKATDNRDLVFGLLGLVNDWGDIAPVVADYSQSPVQVFSEVALAMIKKSRNLGVLEGGRSPERDDSFPSWLPDWLVSSMDIYNSMSQDPWFVSDISAAANSYFEVPSLTRDHGLLIRSLKFDAVVALSTPIESWEDFIAEIFAWKGLAGSITESGSSRSANTFWNAVLCGQVRTSIVNPEGTGQVADDNGRVGYRKATEADYQQCFLAMSKLEKLLVEGWKDRTIQHHIPFLHEMFVNVHDRRMFITERGGIGLARKEIEVADEVWDLSGGDVPFILRRSSRGSELSACYKVVGECFFDRTGEYQRLRMGWEECSEKIVLV